MSGAAASYTGSLSSLTTDIGIDMPVQLLPPLSQTEAGLQPPSTATPKKQSTELQLQQSSASCAVQSHSLHGFSTPKELSSERHTAGRNKYMALLLTPQAIVKPHQWTSVVSISLLHPQFKMVC